MKSPDTTFAKSVITCNSCSLKHICIPHGLSISEMALLEEAIDKSLKVQKKHHLYKANDELTGVFAVKSGAIKTSIINPDGQEQILEFHLPGDLLGFDGFATNTHHCDAIALEDSLLCKLPIKVLDHLCETIPAIRTVMRKKVGKEISHSQDLLLSLGQLPTEERFATYLLELASHFQSRGFSKSEFILPMSRQDLANYLGMAVETLSRILSRLSSAGLIKTEQRKIYITDIEKLEELAHTSCNRDRV